MQIKPDAQVARRIEELLREQLTELGVNPAGLEPHEIAQNMVCQLNPDHSMTFVWENVPILYVMPEIHRESGQTNVYWRMFTKDDAPGETQ